VLRPAKVDSVRAHDSSSDNQGNFMAGCCSSRVLSRNDTLYTNHCKQTSNGDLQQVSGFCGRPGLAEQ
jgi:hypothetical protein